MQRQTSLNFLLARVETLGAQQKQENAHKLTRRHTVETINFDFQNLPPRLRIKTILSTDLSLEDVFRNPETTKIFKQFLTEEHSEENVDFWFAVERYKKHTLFRRAIGRRIFSKYVIDGGKHQINIPQCIRAKIMQNRNTFPVNLFDAAQRHVFELMNLDSFKRFVSSKYCWMCRIKVAKSFHKRFSKGLR